MGLTEAKLSPEWKSDSNIWRRVRSLAPSGPAKTASLFTPVNTPHLRDVSTAPKNSPQQQPQTVATAWSRLKIATPVARSDGMGVIGDWSSPSAQAFDQLRTRLLQSLHSNGWSRVAIASATPGCGSSYVASNLANSFSRISSQRTVLLDMNLRSPGLASRFGLVGDSDYCRFLAGAKPMTDSLVRYNPNLALGLAMQTSATPAELLHDQRTAATLQSVQSTLSPDLMLFDLPPMLAYDDVAAFLPQVDGVLLVADATKTTAQDIADCERAIDGHTQFLGVVLNKSEEIDGNRRY